MDRFVDFRSDTLTKPTPAMLDAMFSAPVGDDVYGEDPTINELERYVAEIVGKEAALYVPSGTMANQIAIHLHCRPGESIICEKESHIFLYEAGGAAANSGVQFELIDREHRLSDKSIESCFRSDWLHTATTTLLAVENTHNMGAGRSFSKAEIDRITKKGRDLGLKVHCDGARLWNAAIAQKNTESELSEGFDTLAVCFSKGLGAPVGSALCGPKKFIEQARKIRKRWGGGMRQAGYIAAGALYALKHNRDRLREDHERASSFVSELKDLSNRYGVEISYPDPGSNMVYFRVNGEGDNIVNALKEGGVLMMCMEDNWVRAVFHYHIEDSGTEKALTILKKYLSRK